MIYQITNEQDEHAWVVSDLGFSPLSFSFVEIKIKSHHLIFCSTGASLNYISYCRDQKKNNKTIERYYMHL